MKFGINQLPKILTATIFVLHLNAYSQDEQSVFEEVIVTAEKEMRVFKMFLKLLQL